MPQKKLYIVWRGACPGIYDNWPDCRAQVIGIKGAKYKSYTDISLSEAEQLFRQGEASSSTRVQNRRTRTSPSRASIHPNAIAVDAACSGNPGKMEYRLVFVETGDVLYASPVYPRGTNNIGEFLAIVHALAWMEQHSYIVPLYSDSKIALSWVRQGKCKSKLAREARTEELYRLIERAEQWLATHDLCRYTLLKWDTAACGEIPADYGRK